MAEELNKKDVEEIRNLRQAETEITKELVSLREKLTTLSRADVLNLSESANIQSRILTLEKEKQGIQSDIVDLSGNALQTDERRAKIAEEQTKRLIQQKETTGDILIKNDKLASSDKIRSNYEKEFVTRASVLAKQRANQQQDNESINKSQKVYNDTVADLAKLREQDAEAYVQLNDLAKRVMDTTLLELDNILDKDAAQKAAREGKFIELKTEKELYGLTEAQYDLIESKKAILEKVNQISNATDDKTREALTGELKLLQMKEELINREFINYSNIIAEKEELNAINKKDADAQAKILEKTEKLKNTIDSTSIGGIFNGIEGQIAKIPGGKALTQAFGFDKMKESINTNLGDSFKSVVGGFQQGGAAGFKGLIGGVQSFGKALLAGPQVAIFALLAAVALLVEMFNGADKAISEVQKTLGGSKEEAVKTYQAAQGMSKEMGIAGVNAQEIVKGMSVASEVMGGIDVASQIKSGNKELEQFAKDATLLSEKFGMSADEIGNIKSLATLTGESMGSLVQKSQGLGKGLMTDKAAMQALASVPKEVAVAFKGGTESLIKASQKAKMLGMDLKKVQDIGDGMLDIESSLAKEMEARVLTGKNLNLDTARQFALTGDIAGLQDELLRQAGSLSEFQDMNRLQQKSMAEAMGMSVDEMTNMLTKAQEARDIGLDSNEIDKLQKLNQEDLAKTIAGTNDAKKKAYLENMAKEKESATMAENLGDIMTKVNEKITAIMAPIVGIIHGMFEAGDAAGGIGSVLDGVFAVLTPIFDIVMGIGKIAFTAVVQPFKLLFSLLSPIFDLVGSIFSVFNSGEGSASGISDIFTKINDIMLSVFGVVNDIGSALYGALIEPSKMLWTAIVTPLWASFQGIFNTFVGLFDVVKKAFEPLFPATAAGEETAGIMDTVKSIFEKMQPVITAVGGIIAAFIITPIQLFADLIGVIVKLFTGDFQGAIDGVGKMFYDLFIGLPKMIYETIFGTIDSIFGTDLKDSVTQFFDFVTGVFGDYGTYIQNIGKLVLDYLMAPFDLVSTVIDGIVQMFSGDFMGGLETIGGGVKDFIMAPFDLVSGLFDNLMGTIGSITDKVSGALSIFGIGGKDKAEKKAEETKGADKSILENMAKEKESATSSGEESSSKAPAYKQQSPADMSVLSPNDYPEGSRARMLAEQGDTKGLEEEVANQQGGGEDKTKTIGAAARGGVIAKGGATLVGEQGPEVVSLPQGSVVANASATQQVGASMNAMGGAGGAEQSESPELTSLKSMDAKLSALLEPLQKVQEVIGGVTKMLSDGLGSVTTNVLGSVGGMLGGMFEGGESESTMNSVQQMPMIGSEGGIGAGGATAGATAGGGAAGVSMSGVEGKLDTLIGVITAAVTQPTIIKFGDRFIEEIKSTIDMKKSYQAENNYGRKV
jgi:hypothetical protein